MITRKKNSGSVFLVVVFAIALIATVTVGIMVMTTEELQLMQNQLYAAQAIAVAEAGLNDTLAKIRRGLSWPTTGSLTGYGTYTIAYEGALPDPNIISTGVSSQGYTARIKAEVTVGTSSPYIIRIDKLRINE